MLLYMLFFVFDTLIMNEFLVYFIVYDRYFQVAEEFFDKTCN